MSTAPRWLNDIVRDFGRQMGLQEFALNDRGAAALRFENGLRLALEYAGGSLVLSIQLALQPTRDALKLLLSQAHPDADSRMTIRSFYIEHTGHGAIAIAFPEGQVTVNALEEGFRALWERGEYLRRNI